ncbi:MAG: hypothetical protein GC168_20815 [Candidatus Hydrogenedens sp.]|nr:hypothetical protein [Candidatus Hydrogenedens sp.]
MIGLVGFAIACLGAVERITPESALPPMQAQSIERIEAAPSAPETITADAVLFAVAALGQTLAEGTAITVRPIPCAFPRLDRLQPAAEAFYGEHGVGDCVLTMRDFWPADPLFPLARARNIRVIEVDASRPLDESGPAISRLEASDGGETAYAWLSLNNLSRMAEIIAHDFTKLAPQNEPHILENLNRAKRQLFQIQGEIARATLDIDDPFVIATTPVFDYFLESTGFYVEGYLEVNSTDSPKQGIKNKSKRIITDKSQSSSGDTFAEDSVVVELEPLASIPADAGQGDLWAAFLTAYRSNLERAY